MQPRDLAKRYMDIVFAGGPYDALSEILAPNSSVTGPYFSFVTAAAYIESLKADAPDSFGYASERACGDEEFVCLIYRFTEPGIATTMAQLFEVADGNICRMLLVLDSRAFE